MSSFSLRHINRLKFPTKHILIVEDSINCQHDIIKHLATIFESEGEIQMSIVPGSVMAASIINNCKTDLIILDHDTPYGNGIDLLEFIKEIGCKIPIITFSGIPSNNDNLILSGANYKFNKTEVINGLADNIIRNILFNCEK